ncbi:hypothetical protein BKP45_10070 [Anaerobacillus alkalidiazotrophicus]|uniref:Uncharacterized protein n=1 Tax=Anaerobacillus alkalidiazotrophicus TaxID=472963 RepID=A0A1S2M663_9BACI|nr:hypothetical protein [Anaerobacillus alkalidiazotrophicus]OIJ20124.1 hypothetical protein BKP45_10070 [Anaerobacillus alkalidiazotrophicus]
MEVTRIRNELSVKGKNGIGFLFSAVVIWSIITIIFLQPIEIHQKNIYMLFSTGLMFPLSVGISSLIRSDWRLKNNPLGDLGLYLNLAQFIYFPILFWGIIKSPNEAIIFFAIITGAHFFPYGWFYNAKPFYVMAPIITVIIIFLGIYLNGEDLWLIPFSMIILILFLILWLILDYRRKS